MSSNPAVPARCAGRNSMRATVSDMLRHPGSAMVTSSGSRHRDSSTFAAGLDQRKRNRCRHLPSQRCGGERCDPLWFIKTHRRMFLSSNLFRVAALRRFLPSQLRHAPVRSTSLAPGRAADAGVHEVVESTFE